MQEVEKRTLKKQRVSQQAEITRDKREGYGGAVMSGIPDEESGGGCSVDDQPKHRHELAWLAPVKILYLRNSVAICKATSSWEDDLPTLTPGSSKKRASSLVCPHRYCVLFLIMIANYLCLWRVCDGYM